MYLFFPKRSTGTLFYNLSLAVAIVALTTMLVGCKKHNPLPPAPSADLQTGTLEGGLPSRPDSIHGFLVAENRKNDHQTGYQYFANRLAMFTEPARPLLEDFSRLEMRLEGSNPVDGNLNVGDVRFGMSKLLTQQSPQTFSYRSQSSAAFMTPPRPVWEVQGNKSVKGFTVDLQKWPLVFDTLAIPSITASTTWTLDTDKYCAEYDSVIVELRHQYNYNNGFIVKRATLKDPVISFSPEELKAINSMYPIVTIRACRYAHIKIDGRIYLFELIKRVEKTISSTQ